MGGKNEKNSGKKGPKCPFLALWSGGFGVFLGVPSQGVFWGEKGGKGLGGGNPTVISLLGGAPGGFCRKIPFFSPNIGSKCSSFASSLRQSSAYNGAGGGLGGGDRDLGYGDPIVPRMEASPFITGNGGPLGPLGVGLGPPPPPLSLKKWGGRGDGTLIVFFPSSQLMML